MKPKKKRNVQDATLKNNRARKNENIKLKQQLDAITLDIDQVFERLEQIEKWLREFIKNNY